MSTEQHKTLFVRSGGGMPGLDIHAGIWRALWDAGIRSTDNSGTSAGAITAAYDSAGWTACQFEELIRSTSDSDVRAPHFGWQVRLPWLESIHDSARIRALLASTLPSTWDAFAKPIATWAVRLRDGAVVDTAVAPNAPCDAVLASASIAGLFPAVTLADGEAYVDGGLRANLPLPANWRNYDRVFLLIASPKPQDYPHRRGIVTNLIRNMDILRLDQIQDALDAVAADPRVTVIRPNCGSGRGMLRFNHNLIDMAYFQTLKQLAEKGLTP